MTLLVFDFIPEISLEAIRALVRCKLFRVAVTQLMTATFARSVYCCIHVVLGQIALF